MFIGQGDCNPRYTYEGTKDCDVVHTHAFDINQYTHRRRFYRVKNDFLFYPQVDDYQNTNVEGVYAVGDACDKKVRVRA